MKITLLGLLCAFALSPLLAQNWDEMAPCPDGRHHAIGFGLDGAGYLVAGAGTDFVGTNTVFKYDPLLDQWEEMDPYPGINRNYGIGGIWGNKAYIGFGIFDGTYLNDLWSFEAATNEWKRLADCDCMGRTHPAFVAHNGKIYVGLGGSVEGDRNDWWMYDIETDKWEQKADFPAPQRHHPYHFAIGDYVYVGFGHYASDIYNDLYRYDPATDTWTQMANLPAEGRVAGTQFSYGSKGYILSGDGDDHSFMETGEFWSYDPATNTWEELPPHPGVSLWAPASFVIGDYVYFTTGERQNNFLTTTWRYKLGNITSVDAPKQAATLAVWPNPFSTALMVEANEAMQHTDNARLRVYNTMMQVVYEGAGNQTKLNLSALPNGLYKLEWSNGENTYNTSILKQ